jgi:RNA polymerase sigma-70 factor, ECF subfamily
LDQTRNLLLRWHGGDAGAMAELVEQEREFVQAQVRGRLGPLLRRSADTQDVVPETMLHALRSAPRFLLSNRTQFRALLARMVENRLRSLAVRQQRHKRDVRRELPMPPERAFEVLDLDRPDDATDPGDAAARDDLRSWVRLALEVLETDDREVLVLRDYQQLSFEQIAAQTGEAADTVRMRHRRALPKLAQALAQLKSGRLDDLL